MSHSMVGSSHKYLSLLLFIVFLLSYYFMVDYHFMVDSALFYVSMLSLMCSPSLYLDLLHIS